MGKYEEALERAKELHESGNALTKLQMEIVFPVLKESEDEEIRQMIENTLREAVLSERISETSYWEMLAYLEKQKAQKPFTPKYRVGDVMRTKQEAAKGITDGLPVIVSVDDHYYYCTNEKIPISEQEEYEFPTMNMRQKPAEWSEEDEKMLKDLICVFSWNQIIHPDGYLKIDECGNNERKAKEFVSWLKSLRPQPHWKPYKEQISALERAIINMHTSSDIGILAELRDNLKKLQL